jgi:hypothetical protein
MTRRLLSVALLALLTLSARAEDNKPPEGFTALFNGKDLTGWKVYAGKMEVWGASDGLLYVEKGGGGWLMTEKEFSDFELRLEYRMPKMGNSGVALRSPLEGDPAYSGMEIQLLDDANWKNLKPTQYTGSIYDVVGPSSHVTKPFGEWNSMRIVCKGRHVSVAVNGTPVVDADLDGYKEKEKSHPGLLRKQGHVGFQSYNFRVDFRNIYIKPL